MSKPSIVASIPVDLPDGRRVRVIAYDDRSIRVRISDSPYFIEEFFGSGTVGQHTIAKFTPKKTRNKEVAMNRQQLTETVQKELAHIPRGEFEQNMFRMAYNVVRRHELSEDASEPKERSFRSALETVRTQHTEFVPVFDAEYFAVRI
jgi:hypothetical protein